MERFITIEEKVDEIVDCILEIAYKIPQTIVRHTEAINLKNDKAEDFYAKKLNEYERIINRRKKELIDLTEHF